MGLHISEIEPVGKLDTCQTQQLAAALWRITADPHSRSSSDAVPRINLTPALVEEVLDQFRSYDAALSLAQIETAGWLETPEIARRRQVPAGCCALSDKANAIAHATTSPRMSFNEACGLIHDLRGRLDAAPPEIDGIRVNRLFVFGSATRDKNGRDEIGDIDVSVDFGFDARYDGIPESARINQAMSTWSRTITGGDDRVQYGALNGFVQYYNDLPGKPCVLTEVWRNAQRASTPLPLRDEVKVQELLQRTQTEHARARSIRAMVLAEESKLKR